MAELGGVNRHRHVGTEVASEGTLSRCPGFARFTFGEILVFGAYGLGTVIQLLGLGNWSRAIGGDCPLLLLPSEMDPKLKLCFFVN